MSASDLAEIIEQYHRAVIAVGRGDPEPAKKLFSRHDDVRACQPLWAGGPRVGSGRAERLARRRFAVPRW